MVNPGRSKCIADDRSVRKKCAGDGNVCKTAVIWCDRVLRIINPMFYLAWHFMGYPVYSYMHTVFVVACLVWWWFVEYAVMYSRCRWCSACLFGEASRYLSGQCMQAYSLLVLRLPVARTHYVVLTVENTDIFLAVRYSSSTKTKPGGRLCRPDWLKIQVTHASPEKLAHASDELPVVFGEAWNLSSKSWWFCCIHLDYHTWQYVYDSISQPNLIDSQYFRCHMSHVPLLLENILRLVSKQFGVLLNLVAGWVPLVEGTKFETVRSYG